MDPLSLTVTNATAGGPQSAAAMEFGPGRLVIEVLKDTTLAFGGAVRPGAPWWEPLEVQRGARFEIGSAQEGVWSYLSIRGGIDAPVVLGSRSTCVRDGIGSWIRSGDVLSGSPIIEGHAPMVVSSPPAIRGPVRYFGPAQGDWSIGPRMDRTGYELGDWDLGPAPATEWSEPTLPGIVQVYPSGKRMILMAEAPTLGGYLVEGIVHHEDLRFVAQTPLGRSIEIESLDQPWVSPL